MATSPGRLWPDERQALLLRAGLAPVPLAIDAWQQAGRHLDPASLDRGSARLLPLIWSHLHRQGVDVAGLEARYRSAREANTRLLARMGELLAPLHEDGIPTVLLKGPALLLRGYADVGERPMSDVDVLVPPARVADAARALRARGWKADAPVTAVLTRLAHSVGFRHPEHVPLDLHWHVFEECCRPSDDDPLWAATVPEPSGAPATRLPAAEDLLLHVCVHGEKWVQVPGIRWVADAVTLIRRGGIDWVRLVHEAARRRFVLRMRAQLAYLRSAFDAPVPAEALAALAAAPVSRIEQFEARWSVRDRRRPWALVYWCNHRRSAPGGRVRAALTFPRYLQAVWHLGSLGEVPGAAVGRMLRSIRRAPKPRPA